MKVRDYNLGWAGPGSPTVFFLSLQCSQETFLPARFADEHFLYQMFPTWW